MNKFSVGIAAAVAAMAVAAQPASAQAAGAGVPVPGGANAASVVGGNRELNAGYNSIVGNADKRNQPAAAARPAKLGEITVGSTLRDVEGKTIGTIFSVDSQGAVVASGDARVKVPLIAFGTDGTGLMLGVTAQRFWELRAKGKTSAQ